MKPKKEEEYLRGRSRRSPSCLRARGEVGPRPLVLLAAIVLARRSSGLVLGRGRECLNEGVQDGGVEVLKLELVASEQKARP